MADTLWQYLMRGLPFELSSARPSPTWIASVEHSLSLKSKSCYNHSYNTILTALRAPPPTHVLKHTKSMPLRNYPISGPITLQSQDSYLQMSYDPSRAPVARKTFEHFSEHTTVGQQTIPSDVQDNDGYYDDLLDIYTGNYSPMPATALPRAAGRENQSQPARYQSPSLSRGAGKRGKAPAFPIMKHENASTPNIVNRPKKKTSTTTINSSHSRRSDRLNSPSASDLHDKSPVPSGKRLYSRYSKPLPPPPRESSIPPIPKVPDEHLVKDTLVESRRNRPEIRIRPGPVAHQWGSPRRDLPRANGRNQVHLYNPEDHHHPRLGGGAAAIAQEVDAFLINEMSLSLRNESNARRR